MFNVLDQEVVEDEAEVYLLELLVLVVLKDLFKEDVDLLNKAFDLRVVF